MDMKSYQHYINGQWTAPARNEWMETENPYTRQPWARIPRGNAADVENAVNAASEAYETGSWGRMSATERGKLLWKMGDLLEANVERLAVLESSDNGRAISDVKGTICYVAEFFRYFGGLADKIEGTVPPLEKPEFFNYTSHEPYGVVAAITPWNGPLLLIAMKLAPGLAAGNAFVVKPHEFASVVVLEFAALFTEAGFPPGVVNVITGIGAEVGEPLVSHAKVRKVAFTGGELVGRAVYQAAARDFKPVTLELGGKSPNIVFEDADLDKAAKGVVMGMFTTTGQACLAGSRLLVQESIHDEFLARLKVQTGAARLGNPAEAGTEMGPLASRAQYDRVLKYLDIARSEGASVALGGGPSTRPGCTDSYFVEPTILTGVNNTMRIDREEVFGPVLCCLTFKDEDDAVSVGNDTPFGLGAGVWTENMRRAIRVSKRLNAGTVWVNSYRALSFMSPFGGYKQSGIGRENGIEAMREYMQTKSVWIGMSETAAPPFGKPYG